MIKPTIGRVVLYNDGVSDQRVSAQIAYVHSDTLINIGGIDKEGNHFAARYVFLCRENDECLAGHAEWMPYQKQQAEKHTKESTE